MKTKAPINQKEVQQELGKLLQNVSVMKEGPKKIELIKAIKKEIQKNREAVKQYLKLRSKMTIDDRKYFDNLTGWFEHQDN